MRHKVIRTHLELFCRVCGDLVLLCVCSLDLEREEDRTLLHELLRCCRLDLLFLRPDVRRCGFGDADTLRCRFTALP